MQSKGLLENELARAGFDVSLIDANLRLDPEARALRHQGALDLVTALAAKGNETSGRPEPVAPAALRR
jgi:hypothetical protein